MIPRVGNTQYQLCLREFEAKNAKVYKNRGENRSHYHVPFKTVASDKARYSRNVVLAQQSILRLC